MVLFLVCVPVSGAQTQLFSAQLASPVAVYSHSAATAGSVAQPVNETQALHEVDQLQRLKKAGMHFDYDLIDAAAFAPDGAYRTFRAAAWPNGPDAWIGKCLATRIRPGLRFGGNTLTAMQSAPAWTNSLTHDGHRLSLFEGGYLPDLVAAMQTWYDRGIRLFAFDSFDLSAATPAAAAKLTGDQIALRNAAALREAFASFHARNRDAVLMIAVEPGNHPDLARLAATGVFTFVSTGAPRPSAVPEASPWRSVDIESDQAVRRFEQTGVPLAQIDSPGPFAGGNAGSDMGPWKGAFLLSMARGGWLNTIHGDLALLQDADARWSARAQKLFLNLQQTGSMHSFGGSPGGSQPYGFAGASAHGSVYVVVNPGQSIASLALPACHAYKLSKDGRVQFRDAGFEPRLSGNSVTLGPGQMAVVGFGAFASSAFNFGVQQDVVIPHSIEPVDADFESTDSGALEASLDPPIEGVVRVVVRPRDAGSALANPKGTQPFTLEAMQYGRPIPVRLDSGSGSQWVVGEIDVNDLTPGVPLKVTLEANSSTQTSLQASAYAVESYAVEY